MPFMIAKHIVQLPSRLDPINLAPKAQALRIGAIHGTVAKVIELRLRPLLAAHNRTEHDVISSYYLVFLLMDECNVAAARPERRPRQGPPTTVSADWSEVLRRKSGTSAWGALLEARQAEVLILGLFI